MRKQRILAALSINISSLQRALTNTTIFPQSAKYVLARSDSKDKQHAHIEIEKNPLVQDKIVLILFKLHSKSIRSASM